MPEKLTVVALRRMLDGARVPGNATLKVKLAHQGKTLDAVGMLGYERDARDNIVAIVVHLLDYPRTGSGLGLGMHSK